MNAPYDSVPAADDEPLFRIRELKKVFGGHVAVNGVSAEIRRGEAVFVLGPSGSGKSTFLRCLNLLETPDGGEIFFRGKRVDARGGDDIFQRMKHKPESWQNSKPIFLGELLLSLLMNLMRRYFIMMMYLSNHLMPTHENGLNSSLPTAIIIQERTSIHSTLCMVLLQMIK